MGNKSSSNKFLRSQSEIIQYQENEYPYLICNDKLKNQEFLGYGSFGVVHRARWQRANGSIIEVAVKSLCQRQKALSQIQTEALQEIGNMQKLKHENIVELYGITINPIQVVAELCDGGSLLNRLIKEDKPVLVTQLLDYSQQLSNGMAYLESQRCIHRDLAARNILLAYNEKIIKISDFGLTKFLELNKNYYKMKSDHGIPYRYCPPESMNEKKFSHKSDVWAYGVTLWEMFTYGDVPWKNWSNDFRVYVEIMCDKKLERPERASSDMYEVMKSCWKINPDERPSFFTLKSTLAGKSMEIYANLNVRPRSLANGLSLGKNEQVIVIDQKNPQIWFGQSIDTHEFGYFYSDNLQKISNIDESECSSTPMITKKSGQVNHLKSFDKSLNDFETTKKKKDENEEKCDIDAWMVGPTSLLIQIEGRHFVMYPQSNDLQKILEKEQLDCCIGSPTDDVISSLNAKFPNLEWITWQKDIENDLCRHNIHQDKIHLSKKNDEQLLNINGLSFKIYKNKNGYIVKGPTIKILYSWPNNINKTTKKQIKKCAPFDMTFFCIHPSKYPHHIKEAYKLANAQKTILLFPKSQETLNKRKIMQEFSKEIKSNDVIVLRENQGCKLPNQAKSKTRNSLRDFKTLNNLRHYSFRLFGRNAVENGNNELIGKENAGAENVE